MGRKGCRGWADQCSGIFEEHGDAAWTGNLSDAGLQNYDTGDITDGVEDDAEREG